MSTSSSIQLTQKKNRSNFTLEEDKYLISLIARHGEGDWIFIAKLMRSRNSRQCRERWNNYLNPRLNRKDWTAEDDRILMQLFQQNGAKWKYFTLFFEGRTDTMLKNRYNQLKRKESKIIINNETQIEKSTSNAMDTTNTASNAIEISSNISNECCLIHSQFETENQNYLPESSESEIILDYVSKNIMSKEIACPEKYMKNDNDHDNKQIVNNKIIKNNINENSKVNVLNTDDADLDDFLELNENYFFNVNALDSENGDIEEIFLDNEFLDFE